MKFLHAHDPPITGPVVNTGDTSIYSVSSATKSVPPRRDFFVIKIYSGILKNTRIGSCD